MPPPALPSNAKSRKFGDREDFAVWADCEISGIMKDTPQPTLVPSANSTSSSRQFRVARSSQDKPLWWS
jgi:hypothetical protein